MSVVPPRTVVAVPVLVAAGPRRPSSTGRRAVAVGNFDGVHLGHARIVERLLEAGRRLDVPSAVLTFDPHPALLLRPQSAPVPLTTPARRAELLVAAGVDAVFVQPVDAALLALDARGFYRRVLRGALDAAAIVEGHDFRFGAGRAGDMDLLRRLGAEEGVEVAGVEAVLVGGEPVSSSRVRALVAAGDVAAAAALLAAPYRISGEVVHGRARGRTLGFPTANLASVATLLPAPGVYAGRARVAGSADPWRAAAIHLGAPVTFGAAAATVEVHLVGFDGDLYGRRLDVDFLARLRDTRRFDSPAELAGQLAADVAGAAAVAGGE